MPSIEDISREEFERVLDYNPETGDFHWKVNVSARGRAGKPAGVYRTPRRTTGRRYLYIMYKNRGTPAARLAWFFTYGEWPKETVKYKDDNPENLRAENLTAPKFPALKASLNGERVYRMSGAASRYYGLRRYYGMTPEKYDAMHRAQNGCCAICGGPEVATHKGRLKMLHVDHNHDTGRVRELLCFRCNAMIGSALENPEILRSAISYLEKHAASDALQPMQGETQ